MTSLRQQRRQDVLLARPETSAVGSRATIAPAATAQPTLSGAALQRAFREQDSLIAEINQLMAPRPCAEPTQTGRVLPGIKRK